ncbi:MAG: ABC transporter permease [Hydrogenibacillus schlegelii]|uniref:ABC transporter permease n=1 Tax=Hydrogenibacillus schlegelii TaxID=1484 RepID=A0A947CY40_HYDSH|nr:ABC transporter permease [Hydrogenibacillus schlegelii]
MRRSLSVLFRKEVADHLHSWRFNILIALIALTTLASLYTAAQTIRSVVPQADQPLGDIGLFLKLFTTTDGKLPSFVAFVGFLAPLLGLGMAFDAISSERNKGTLVRLLSQPIYRDDVILAKWFAALAVVGVFFLALNERHQRPVDGIVAPAKVPTGGEEKSKDRWRKGPVIEFR